MGPFKNNVSKKVGGWVGGVRKWQLPFKYNVRKEVGGWGQKMTSFADLQYYLC